jgi:hypothetical protein
MGSRVNFIATFVLSVVGRPDDEDDVRAKVVSSLLDRGRAEGGVVVSLLLPL